MQGADPAGNGMGIQGTAQATNRAPLRKPLGDRGDFPSYFVLRQLRLYFSQLDFQQRIQGVQIIPEVHRSDSKSHLRPLTIFYQRWYTAKTSPPYSDTMIRS